MVPVPLGGPGVPKKSQVTSQKRRDWDEFRSTYQQSFWYSRSRRSARGSVRRGSLGLDAGWVLGGGRARPSRRRARACPAIGEKGIAGLLPLLGDDRETDHDLLVNLLRGCWWGGFGVALVGSRGGRHRPILGARIGSAAAHAETYAASV